MAKQGTSAHELDDMNATDLEARLREAKEELFNLRFQAATGQLESHGRLRAVRKDIARIYTVMTERALGITEEVEATAAADAATEAEAEAVSDDMAADDSDKAGSKA